MNQQTMRDRRSFLRLSAGAIGVGVLPACGGEEAAETDTAGSTGSTSTTGSSSGAPDATSGEPIPTTGEPASTGTTDGPAETGTEASSSSSGTGGDTDVEELLPGWLDGQPLNEWF